MQGILHAEQMIRPLNTFFYLVQAMLTKDGPSMASTIRLELESCKMPKAANAGDSPERSQHGSPTSKLHRCNAAI